MTQLTEDLAWFTVDLIDEHHQWRMELDGNGGRKLTEYINPDTPLVVFSFQPAEKPGASPESWEPGSTPAYEAVTALWEALAESAVPDDNGVEDVITGIEVSDDDYQFTYTSRAKTSSVTAKISVRNAY
jgi:hypothetical protein